jgi:hypothetical protein
MANEDRSIIFFKIFSLNSFSGFQRLSLNNFIWQIVKAHLQVEINLVSARNQVYTPETEV